MGADKHMTNVPAAVEIFMKAGDVLLFVDSTAHGSAARTNDGERRFALYRYGPNWGSSRYGYVPSDGLLERLSPHPERYKIIRPLEPLRPPADEVPLARVGSAASAKL